MEKGKIEGIRTPKPLVEPIVTKFGMGDYVGDVTQHAKIQTDRPSGASRLMGEISPKSKMADGRHLGKSKDGHISTMV